MGMNQFEEEYLECFEQMATNVHNQSVGVRDIEKTLLSKEFQNRHYDIIMDEVKTICNSTCEAIDNHFQNLSATINSLKNVLMWKSQVQLIPEKLARALNPDVQVNHPLQPPNCDSCFSPMNDSNQNKNDRKCGTAKVSPMIKGHVISAPRIHLNRVCKNFGSAARHPFANKLSPIIEQSPNTKSHESPSPGFRNIQVPIQRLKIGNFAGKTAESEDSNDANNSPEINFTGRNCAGFELRRRYSSRGGNERFQMMRDRRAEVVNGNKHDEEVADHMNEENPSFRSEAVESDVLHNKSRRNINDDVDPLEGPSWLLNKQRIPEESDHSGHFKYVNFNRLNYARSNRALSDESRKDVSNYDDEAEMGNFEVSPNEREEIRENSSLVNDGSGKNSSNEDEELSFEDPLPSVPTERPKGYDKCDTSILDGSSSSSSGHSSENRNSPNRNSVHQKDESSVLTEPESASMMSNRNGRLSNGCNSSSSGNRCLTPRLSMNCYVNLNKLRLERDTIRVKEIRRSFTVEPMTAGWVSIEGSAQRKRNSSSTGKTPKSEVPNERRRGSVRLRRTKRRAAEQCIEKKVWVDVTPKWETKIKRKKAGRRTGSVAKKSKKGSAERVE